MIQKAFLQRFTSYELLSVIELFSFLLFFEGDFFYSKTARIGVDMALCLSIANATSCIILAKFCSM